MGDGLLTSVPREREAWSSNPMRTANLSTPLQHQGKLVLNARTIIAADLLYF